MEDLRGWIGVLVGQELLGSLLLLLLLVVVGKVNRMAYSMSIKPLSLLGSL